ncbi:hypothetical protein [Thermocoleostomius sinensis]|uniref:Uncharacterized protein n=1 Tax=Thermocoleostomius sinensis A174 TaxID=2016057 RepID=A0A9E8ZEN0_9CYAN|nr:hypothetical protein [Thermocoleostomius sinensis]WAL61753.1 hypothetical protein OXH18_07135 [Thermocoleostomius sinensis A174]
MSDFPQAIQLPPRVPPDEDEISRAICLLGNRIAAELKEKTKIELVGLIGVYPTPEQAKYWKHGLKQLLKNDPDLMSVEEMIRYEIRDEVKREPPPESKSCKRRSKRHHSRRYAKRTRSQPQPQSNQPLRPQPDETLAANGYPFAGVSNFASIDLDRFRHEEDDWDY